MSIAPHLIRSGPAHISVAPGFQVSRNKPQDTTVKVKVGDAGVKLSKADVQLIEIGV